MKKFIISMLAVVFALTSNAQTALKKVYNEEINPIEQIGQYTELSHESLTLLQHGMERLKLSARTYNRILKVARTIADLEGSEKIQSPHIA